MTVELADFARALGLDASATVLESFRSLPMAAPPDTALSAPPATNVQTALAQLVRRGFGPSPVSLLRQAFASDPLERGLLAWDVLNGSLLPRDATLDELRNDARTVAPIVAAPGCACINLATVRQEIDRAPAAGSRIINVLRRLGADALEPDDASADALERARNFARILHRSHLSTMASFFLADLVLRHRYRPALPDLVEVLLDQEAPDVESWLQQADDPSIELLTYARVRALNSGQDWKTALTFADTHRDIFVKTKLTPEQASLINPRPTLAYAEACLRNGRATVAYEHVAAITNLENPWRYAFRILLLYGATRIKERQFVALLETFLQSFGNDEHVWYDSLAAAPDGFQWAEGMSSLLVREAFTLWYDASVWKSVALVFGDGTDAQAAHDEITARILTQTRIVEPA